MYIGQQLYYYYENNQNPFIMNKTIIPQNGVYAFSFKAITRLKGSPNTLIGRNICCLWSSEKENFMIKKLLEKVRKPSSYEAMQFEKTFRIYLEDGVCWLYNEKTNFKTEVFNIGTKNTPAFFFGRFLFVFDPKRAAFCPVDLKIVFFNQNYTLIILPQNLLVAYDVKGFHGLGNFVSVTSVPNGYILATDLSDTKQGVYALTDKFQLLFETKECSKFSVFSQYGIVSHEYADGSSYTIDQYVPSKDGYVLE